MTCQKVWSHWNWERIHWATLNTMHYKICHVLGNCKFFFRKANRIYSYVRFDRIEIEFRKSLCSYRSNWIQPHSMFVSLLLLFFNLQSSVGRTSPAWVSVTGRMFVIGNSTHGPSKHSICAEQFVHEFVTSEEFVSIFISSLFSICFAIHAQMRFKSKIVCLFYRELKSNKIRTIPDLSHCKELRILWVCWFVKQLVAFRISKRQENNQIFSVFFVFFAQRFIW